MAVEEFASGREMWKSFREKVVFDWCLDPRVDLDTER